MTISGEYLSEIIASYLLVFFRIAAFVSILPVFNSKTIPLTSRIGLSLFITAIIVPGLPNNYTIDPFSISTVVLIANQILIGLLIGFSVRIIFSALETGGYMIGQTMGLGFAQMMDPANGVTIPVVSQFYTVLATLVFLLLNGHLLMLGVLVESFSTIPVGGDGLSNDGLWKLIEWSSWIFKGAVMIALPAVGALLIVNVAFGVMMRAAPQLNIFTIGFPISLMLGLFFIFITLPMFLPQFTQLLDSTILSVGDIIRM